jgi:uncharacterized peroxidase-related enzyme
MTYIRTVEETEATGSLARAYQQSRQAQGRLFETEKLLSLWPEVMAMEMRRYQTVILAPSHLSRAEKEMIATAVSAANRCAYCVHHHRQMMVEAGVVEEMAAAIAKDYMTADLDERTRAMLDFAVTERPDLSGPEEVARLRQAGLDDRQMLEAIVVAGFFRDYNLRVSIFGLEIEDE